MAKARQQRMTAQFPELGIANSADELLGIDAMKIARGELPSTFTQMVYRLGARMPTRKR